MWPLKTVLYFTVFWCLCLGSVVNPIWGVVNYIIAYQLHPPVHWWGLPLVAIGMRFSMLTTLFLLLGLFFARNKVPTLRPFFSLWEFAIVGMVTLGALNTVLGIGFSGPAQGAFEKFWKLQVFVLVMVRLATTRKNLGLVIWAIVAGCWYLGYDAYTAPKWRFNLGRLNSFGGPDIATSSGASAHLAAMLPIVGIAFLIAKHRVWRAFAAVTGALTLNAIFLCKGRGAFVGLLAGGITALLMAPRTKRFRVVCLLIIGGLCAFRLSDDTYWDRMGTLVDNEALAKDYAVEARIGILKESVRILADHPTGVGLGNFTLSIGPYNPEYYNRTSHNTFVTCFVELGLLGGLLFLSIIAGSAWLLFRTSRIVHLTNDPVRTTYIVYGLMISLSTYVVAGLGTERFSCESFWWVLALPLCVNRMAAGEAQQAADVPALVHAQHANDGAFSWGRVPNAV